MNKLTVVIRALIHTNVMLWWRIRDQIRYVLYGLKKGKLRLNKEERGQYHLDQMSKSNMTEMFKVIQAQRVIRALLKDDVHPIAFEMFGPLFRENLTEYTPLRLRQLDRLLLSPTPDIEMFIRIYTEGVIPPHQRQYLKSTGEWDTVIRKLLESKHSVFKG